MKSLANAASQVGQTFIIAVAVLLHNLVELAGHAGKDAVTRDGHLFSAYLMLPLATTSLALLHFNWCVTSHSSNSYSSDSIARYTFFECPIGSCTQGRLCAMCHLQYVMCGRCLRPGWHILTEVIDCISGTNIRCLDRK